MLITFILILTPLIILNFVLLIFSCNDVSKTTEAPKVLIVKTDRSLKKEKTENVVSNQLEQRSLAATGS